MVRKNQSISTSCVCLDHIALRCYNSGHSIAKADEIEDPNTGRQVAYNVTFDKLKQKILAENIAIDQFPEVGFAGKKSGLGHVYSRPGGLSETVRLTNKDMWIRQLDSVRVSYPYLRDWHSRSQKRRYPADHFSAGRQSLV